MKVKFYPSGEEFDIQPNQTVLELAQEKGVYIKTVCNGNASCAECRVNIKEGEQNVLAPSAKELSMIGTGYFVDQRRLSCQLRCFGDVTIDLTEQIEKKSASPKKVLGNRKMDAETSHAVSAMILKEEHELVEKVEAKVQQQDRQRSGDGGGRGKSKNRRGRNRNRNRGRGGGRGNKQD